MQITVKIEDGEVRQSLQRVGEALPHTTKRAMKQAMMLAMEEARKYPPKRRGSRYQRTGTYFRSFKILENEARSITMKSDAQQKGRRYTRYVGGFSDGTGQAGIHKGRWKIIAKAVSEWVVWLTKRIITDTEAILRREGLK